MNKGDYVVATKWHDGDPADHWCVGWYDGGYDHFGTVRHMVLDGEGKNFRANGFRRVKKISAARGKWLLENAGIIEKSGRSLWYWVRAKMRVGRNGLG